MVGRRLVVSFVLSVCSALGLAACSQPGAQSAAPALLAPGSPAAPLSDARSLSSMVTSAVGRLRSYNVDPARVFVAGISSGGFFGVQMHVAHSRTFKGAAIYAGGVYYCAQDSIVVALTACGGEGLYASTLAASEVYLDSQASQGTIDPPRHLVGQPVYLWSGTQDAVVKQAEMDDLHTEYERYGARVRYDDTYPAAHGWESPDGELPCGTQGEPYLIACDRGTVPYDSERTWLTMFLGRLNPRNDGALRGSLVHFDQTEFGASASNSLDTNGYAFVPRSCAWGARCGLVLALHGCLQTQSDIGTKFITEGGIDPWADTNDMIVLYPFAVKSSTVPLNPNGCWDWWGYDDPSYALKSGTQMTIVYDMVERVMGQGRR